MKLNSLCSGILIGLMLSAIPADADDWKDKAIEPVVNPLFFEDPLINSEVRPVFLWHKVDSSFIPGGADVRVYAAQIRYAINDRLAIIATKDGYIEIDPNAGPGTDGWADIGAGLKYALIDDVEKQLVVTPGLKIEFPTGNRDVFQGNGKGEWNLFVSAIKGFGNFHVLGSGGVRLPNDWDKETASAHYSLQLDYYTCRWFIPFIAANGHTVLSEADVLPINVEGFDLINFGATDAGGRTQITLGAGFRSRLHERVDLGFAYEFGATDPKGLFKDRYTVDLVFRF